MPPQTTPLAAFIAARLAEVATPLELFAACDDAGVDLAELVDVLADPYGHLPEDPAWRLEYAVEGSLEYLAYYLVEFAVSARAAAGTAGHRRVLTLDR